MDLYGYSERGLVNAFCYDCVRSNDGESFLAEMLQESCFPSLVDTAISSGIRKATFLVEQSLSQFGDCDLIILCDSNDERKFVIYCEFKRGSSWSLKEEWNKFTVRVENNIREQLTSNLFCQLYFKQRFTAALADASPEHIEDGLEFDEPLSIRGGNGRRKIGTNQTVLRAVEMIRPYAKTPFFLMVTPETIDRNELEGFIQQTNDRQAFLRGWSSHRWGHLNLSAVHRFCERHQSAFHHTLSVFEFNQGQLY